MAPGQSSFRRILLSRILLVSVPVLLVGVYVTYRKARSAFLETARQNLTESAVRKGEIVKQSIDALRNNLASASDAAISRSDMLDPQLLIAQLKEVLPTDILCAQITDLNTDSVIATTCKEEVELENSTWQKKKQRILTTSSQINVKLLLPSTSLIRDSEDASENPFRRQLKLWLTAPVYDRNGDLRYALSVKSAILAQDIIEPGSLEGYPVVIDQDGTILAHPFVQRVGRNIKQMPDARRLNSLLQNAISNEPDFLHLFYLETDGVELVAGYSSIPSPVTKDNQEKWIILAVSPLDAALLPLKDIRQALVSMTLGLIAASSLATLYVSRELARPLEQIRDYSLKNEERLYSSSDRLPENFQIREFNQLSLALNDMVGRLRAWGEEIVSAWKEAQNANKLKSEFLATTSHELRTPLNGIINCIRIVQDGYCDNIEEEREFLQQADDAAIHLLGIINDVLDISKIEAGKLSVTIEKVELRKILNEVIDLHLVPIQRKDLNLKTPIWNENIYVLADPAKLKQILINILSNAVKFTDYGGIDISVTTITTEENLEPENEPENLKYLFTSTKKYHHPEIVTNDHHSQEMLENNEHDFAAIHNHNTTKYSSEKRNHQEVVITIEDTGIGIPINQQSKLFNPFVMVDGSTTRKFGGTGLGLAISRNLVELMQGKISLESAGEAQGTLVKISLPLAEIATSVDLSSQIVDE
ncbi:ATP-binding protein [Pleurocapsa sp. PCC 7319]|uniref:ATP-binding protein n=1 Tax=Pleurocapsa sp. PCC 7319 TaxID=118161 RepID=UPI000377F444|nr:ATP-binding protein [Pleurocapsa sp. PCC 7319]